MDETTDLRIEKVAPTGSDKSIVSNCNRSESDKATADCREVMNYKSSEYV